jgi:hypothetical protein
MLPLPTLCTSLLLLLAVPLLTAGSCGEDEAFSVDPCEVDADQDDDGQDSVACGGLDCDDTDSGRSPAAVEVCDAADKDEDCDPNTFGERDLDDDGHPDGSCCNTDPSGGLACGTDCDDQRPGVNPDAPEVCNEYFDDDCDGAIDETVRVALYEDMDGDGYGTGEPSYGCFLTEGVSYLGNDCDDKNAAIVPGEMRCADANSYQICSATDGTWAAAEDCPGQALCRAQPNGTGVCI